MALDTASRRASAFGYGLPFAAVFPVPDGDISAQDDRQHVAYAYPGILAGEAVATNLHGRRPRYRRYRDFDEFLRRKAEAEQAEQQEIAARKEDEEQRRIAAAQRRRDIERYQQQQLAAIEAALDRRELAISQAEAERQALSAELAALMIQFEQDQEDETLFLLLAAA